MRRSSFFVVSLAAALVACGSSSTPATNGDNDSGPGASDAGPDTSFPVADSGGDTGNPNPDTGTPDTGVDSGPFVQAAHPAFPILIDQGGVVLHTPKIVTVTFPGDADKATYESFGATAANNTWWDTIRQGYCETGSTTNCVGDGPAGTSIELTTAPATTYSDAQDPTAASTLKTFIKTLIPSKIPLPDAQTILAFYFPTTTTITLNGNSSSCQQFGGYHNSMTIGTTTFTYAVLPECAAQMGQTLTVAQETIFAASHEFAEAATDPYVTATSSGFYLNFNDNAILPWNGSGGGEAGDMCVDSLGLGQDETTEGSFTVQRIWNNAAALAGGDPCVPAITRPYFNVAPDQWLVTANPGGAEVTMMATAFSDKPTSAWTIRGYDLNASQLPDGGIDANPYLSFTVNGVAKTTVNNGDRVKIGVTLHQDPGPLTQSVGGAIGWILSSDGATIGTSKYAQFWPILVTSPADAVDAGLDTVDAAQDMPIPRRTPRMPVLTSNQRDNLIRAIRAREQ
jgi:hypothetical protein